MIWPYTDHWVTEIWNVQCIFIFKKIKIIYNSTLKLNTAIDNHVTVIQIQFQDLEGKDLIYKKFNG